MPERHRRTARVAVMLTENERRRLDRIATRELLSISSWLRKIVVAELVRQTQSQEVTQHNDSTADGTRGAGAESRQADS